MATGFALIVTSANEISPAFKTIVPRSISCMSDLTLYFAKYVLNPILVTFKVTSFALIFEKEKYPLSFVVAFNESLLK
ncbi:hypothetical protein D3C72_2333940 [compost metagenome]